MCACGFSDMLLLAVGGGLTNPLPPPRRPPGPHLSRARLEPHQDGRFVQLGNNGKLVEQGTEVEVVQPQKRVTRQVSEGSCMKCVAFSSRLLIHTRECLVLYLCFRARRACI